MDLTHPFQAKVLAPEFDQYVSYLVVLSITAAYTSAGHGHRIECR